LFSPGSTDGIKNLFWLVEEVQIQRFFPLLSPRVTSAGIGTMRGTLDAYHLAGCRGFTGPVPPPLLIKAVREKIAHYSVVACWNDITMQAINIQYESLVHTALCSYGKVIVLPTLILALPCFTQHNSSKEDYILPIIDPFSYYKTKRLFTKPFIVL
jgi:hypothetical protein